MSTREGSLLAPRGVYRVAIVGDRRLQRAVHAGTSSDREFPVTVTLHGHPNPCWSIMSSEQLAGVFARSIVSWMRRF